MKWDIITYFELPISVYYLEKLKELNFKEVNHYQYINGPELLEFRAINVKSHRKAQQIYRKLKGYSIKDYLTVFELKT